MDWSVFRVTIEMIRVVVSVNMTLLDFVHRLLVDWDVWLVDVGCSVHVVVVWHNNRRWVVVDDLVRVWDLSTLLERLKLQILVLSSLVVNDVVGSLVEVSMVRVVNWTVESIWIKTETWAWTERITSSNKVSKFLSGVMNRLESLVIGDFEAVLLVHWVADWVLMTVMSLSMMNW